jgi:ribosomal protein S21
MIQVVIRPNEQTAEGINRALKRLKTKVEVEGIMDEVRLHRNFLSVAERKKAKTKIKHRKAKLARAQADYSKTKK